MKTKDAGIVSGILVPVDSFHESMDSYGFMVTNPDSKKVRFVLYDTIPGFVSYNGSQIQLGKDSFCIVHTNPANFQKIRPVFTNPTNLVKISLRIKSMNRIF